MSSDLIFNKIPEADELRSTLLQTMHTYIWLQSPSSARLPTFTNHTFAYALCSLKLRVIDLIRVVALHVAWQERFHHGEFCYYF